jgi:hypothetical protein
MYNFNSYLLLLFTNIFCDIYIFAEVYWLLYHWGNFEMKRENCVQEQVVYLEVQVCPLSVRSTFQDLPQLRATADNTKCYV